jgi:CheY-like chemotaxis protein
MAMAQTIAHDALAMIEYGDEPSILVLTDSEAGGERARQSIEWLGYRMIAAVPLQGGLERLRQQTAMSAVYLDIEHDRPTGLEPVLDHLEDGAVSGRFGAVVSAPTSLIDLVAARAWHLNHLATLDEGERVTALACAAAPSAPRLHDVRKQQVPRLQQLSEEVGRIASILATLSEDEALEAPAAPDGKAEGGIEAGQVRAIIRARRLRDQYFNAQLFADPAWDMLLDLMAARLERQRVAVSSLCIAAAVPATTALRWIKTLTDQGLFVRRADPQDGRRVYIELSDKAAAGLEAYLKAAQRISPLIL